MKISEMINALEEIKQNSGDLSVLDADLFLLNKGNVCVIVADRSYPSWKEEYNLPDVFCRIG